MDLQLAGKTVVVTGGSGAIGRGLVLEFLREGARVVNADVDDGAHVAAAAAEQGLPGRLRTIRTDVTQRASVDAAFERARTELGPVDVLVNNAGGGSSYAYEFEDLSDAQRAWEMALNVDGVIHCTQAALRDMIPRRSGSIVNIASAAAVSGLAGGQAVHYAGTKGFVLSWGRALAWQLGKHGIRVNTICPGWIVPHHGADAPGPSSFWQRLGGPLGLAPEEIPRALEDGTLWGGAQPLARLGRPEDIAHAALFFASHKSGFLTGQVLHAGGGGVMP
jgi:NAD(P)-dependent dehydrogenase (short-subunit alcohol dehydrogenase family)